MDSLTQAWLDGIGKSLSMSERFDIDVGYNDPLDPRDPEPEDKPSPAEYEDRELDKAAPGSVHDHACCPPDDCCGGPCAAHPCWDLTT